MTLAELITKGALTYVKEGTQKAKNMLYSFHWGDNAESLYEVYERCSGAKNHAYNYCINLRDTLKGIGGFICSHNTFMFTYGFIVRDDNLNLYLVYVTKAYNYITPLRD